jgi:mitogen-activated protein kinase 1/3
MYNYNAFKHTKVGSGAYGIVIEAEDTLTTDPKRRRIAIKKIEKCFEHRFYAKRTLRELKILRLLKHENVMLITHIFYSRSSVSTPFNSQNHARASTTCIITI